MVGETMVVVGKKECAVCGSPWHYKTFCPYNKKKRPKLQSDKELDYQEWKETVARPAIIRRDGNWCFCCGRPARPSERLDLEHTQPKGSHPELKRQLTNLRLFCRYPCHFNKTNHLECLHEG